MAKPLANGFPIGAVMVSQAVAEEIKIGDHGNHTASLVMLIVGTTFGGNPLATRIAHHVFQRLSSSEMLNQITSTSTLFQARLTKLYESYPRLVTEIRGRGLILGIQLRSIGPKTSTETANMVVRRAREKGLLLITAGEGTIRLVPPLNIPENVATQGLDILEQVMKEVHQEI